MPDTITIEQAMAQLGKMGASVEHHVARGLSFGLEKYIREPAVIATVRSGVGRRLWSAKRAGAFAMFKREPIKLSGGRLITAVIVKGMPALAETGGVTKAHTIKAKGRLLSFVVKGRRIAVAMVKHPGSRIAKTGTVERLAAQNEERIAGAIRFSLDLFLSDVQKG